MPTCAELHGGFAKGVEGLGLSLVDSGFLASVRTDGFVSFMHVGRPSSLPDNTTGVGCPPLGGNPTLTDEDLTTLLAYLQSLNTS